MTDLPDIEFQPRVESDIEDLIAFVSRYSRGKPAARRQDIENGLAAILRGPTLNDVSVRRRDTGIELRRHNAAQFAIIYAYYPPSDERPRGLLSIRAVRHSRARNVFRGVREAVATFPVSDLLTKRHRRQQSRLLAAVDSIA